LRNALCPPISVQMTESSVGVSVRRMTLVSFRLPLPERPIVPFVEKRKRHLSFSQITPNSENGIARASMTTSCLKGSKRQRIEMTGAMDSSKQSMHECRSKKSTASASPRCRSTRTPQVGFGRNRTIDFDSSLPACFIGLRPVERWSSESLSPSSPPNSQRRTICDTVPRLPTRDTLPRPPIRVVAIKLEELVLLAASSHDLL
jgi:hypothetical protein